MTYLKNSINDFRAAVLWRFALTQGHDTSYDFVRQLVDSNLDAEVLNQIELISINRQVSTTSVPSSVQNTVSPSRPAHGHEKRVPEPPKMKSKGPSRRPPSDQTHEYSSIIQLMLRRLRRIFHIS